MHSFWPEKLSVSDATERVLPLTYKIQFALTTCPHDGWRRVNPEAIRLVTRTGYHAEVSYSERHFRNVVCAHNGAQMTHEPTQTPGKARGVYLRKGKASSI